MRSVSDALATAQTAATRTPYIHLLFTSKDGLTTYDLSTNSAVYGNRILKIDFREEPFNDYGKIFLQDYDSNIPNLKGYWTEIGYGDKIGANYEKADLPRLYVKHQHHVSASGNLYTILELEGLWTKMWESFTLGIGSAPLYQLTWDGTVNTIYTIMKAVIAQAGLSLPVNCPVNDGIISTLFPFLFSINDSAYESVKQIMYRLITMTKCYLRPPSATGLQFGVVYPQAADAAVLTYYSNQIPYFKVFTERSPVLVPNHFIVYGNRGTDGDWTELLTSASPHGVSQADIDALYEVSAIALAPDMTVQADVDLQADVQLIRALAEKDSGVAIIPHDCRVELYDKLAFIDNRRTPSTTYPSGTMTRVAGLRHIFQPGKYDLEVYLGGLSTTDPVSMPDTLIYSRWSEGAPLPTTEKIKLAALRDIEAASREQREALQELRNAEESPYTEESPYAEEIAGLIALGETNER